MPVGSAVLLLVLELEMAAMLREHKEPREPPPVPKISGDLETEERSAKILSILNASKKRFQYGEHLTYEPLASKMSHLSHF